MKAPFPWFGGKSRVAHIVWAAFGDVPNYVEPFFGSGAVLLGRPTDPRIETANDRDCYLSNFWRSVAWPDPVERHKRRELVAEEVARWADWPVNEADLHARHRWLVAQAEFRERMQTDPNFYDAKIAGWWVWGLCQWIGRDWCSKPYACRPHLSTGGMGVHASGHEESIYEMMTALQARLRRVRVCCGDWSRVLSPIVTEKIGVTGIFLDPPYSAEAGRDPALYSTEDLEVAHAVRDWALTNGTNPRLRIALCGYEDEHLMPDTWACVPWKAAGGYAASAGNTENADRERIWFSPACLPLEGEAQRSLFAEVAP